MSGLVIAGGVAVSVAAGLATAVAWKHVCAGPPHERAMLVGFAFWMWPLMAPLLLLMACIALADSALAKLMKRD